MGGPCMRGNLQPTMRERTKYMARTSFCTSASLPMLKRTVRAECISAAVWYVPVGDYRVVELRNSSAIDCRVHCRI